MKKKLNCVLLIDDDEPTNFINSMALRESNCTNQVRIAPGGQEALKILSHNETRESGNSHLCPELIFLDVNMPSMNGWEFLDKYKALKQRCKGEIIIIMLTTSINPDDKEKAAGIPEISGFEDKPLTGDMINRVLHKHFMPYL